MVQYVQVGGSVKGIGLPVRVWAVALSDRLNYPSLEFCIIVEIRRVHRVMVHLQYK